MNDATIQGRPVGLDEAVARSAAVLRNSRLPVIAGLAADVAGARAAIRLAERCGAAIDHMASDAALRELSVLRDRGLLTVTPDEARRRADLVLLAGLMTKGASLLSYILAGRSAPEPSYPSERSIVALCPGMVSSESGAFHNVEIVGDDPNECLAILASLRARVNGRPCGEGPVPGAALDALAARLKAARYGVAIWSAEALSSLEIEMLTGLVTDLNAGTRWAGLPLSLPGNAAGVNLAAGWMCGYPVRTGFGRGLPEHDPWTYEARRLAESGEADALLWISALDDAAPDWTTDIPIVALVAEDGSAPAKADIVIRVGRPGRDHDAVLFDPRLGTLSSVRAEAASDRPSVAHVIGRIAGELA